jgi:hypothetical protein
MLERRVSDEICNFRANINLFDENIYSTVGQM